MEKNVFVFVNFTEAASIQTFVTLFLFNVCKHTFFNNGRIFDKLSNLNKLKFNLVNL